MAVFCKKQLVRDEETFQKRTLDTLIKNKEKNKSKNSWQNDGQEVKYFLFAEVLELADRQD